VVLLPTPVTEKPTHVKGTMSLDIILLTYAFYALATAFGIVLHTINANKEDKNEERKKIPNTLR